MTKKIFLGMSAMAMLFATSCKDDFAESFVGDQATVEFSISTPEIGTRAYSDGMTATKLQYAVYDAAGKELTALRGQGEKMVTLTNGKANVKLDLTTGESYKVIFWAAAENAPYTVNFTQNIAEANMTVNYTGAKSNDESRDAFYVCKPITVKGAQTETIELRRPFAQLNIGTEDYQKAADAGYTPTKSAVTVKNIYSTLNLASGEVSDDVEVTFDYTAIPSAQDGTFPVAGYEYLAMNYLLVGADQEVVDIEFGYTETDANAAKTRTVGSVPVQRNYRTNIYGKLLTSTVDVNVEIKPEYNGALTADDLQLAAAVGGTVTLEKDIVLDAPLKVQANMVLNLNGKTITTTEKETGRHHYAIDNYATLVIEGEGAINARGIQNFGQMTINGDITITNVDTNGGAAIWNEGKLTINDGTFKTNKNARNGSKGGALQTCLEGEAVVNGGTFEAYSQLTYAIINEGKTVINNATVKGKHGAVCGSETNDQTTINGGSFELMENPGVSDHCAYYVSNIKGGSFTLGNNTDCGAQVFYKSTIAAGYKDLKVDNLYYVLPEAIADAAGTANVTTVTESTADVSKAIGGVGVALFMWNDVAYIAETGKVSILASEEGKTTVRGIVESTALTSATVAEGIEVVGNRTFRKCANLETVALPNTLTEIGPAVFQSCSKLANVTIPASVKTIGEGAFAECTSLTSINIPNGITRLEKDVLRNTGLTSIEIPASVTYIGTYAFRDCESLTEVKILSPEFTIENNSFTNTAAPVPTMTIYVVNAEMKAYLDSVLTNYDKSYITVVVM